MPSPPPPSGPARGPLGHPDAALDLRIEATATGLLVTVTGELDVVTTPYLLNCLNGHLARAGGGEVDLDLAGLTFMDLTGVRAVLDIRDRVTRARGRLVVRGLDPARLPVVAALGLDQSLSMHLPGRGGKGSRGPRG